MSVSMSVISMILSDSYATGFDEDVPNKPTVGCPECGGLVTTNVVETACEDCGLVIEERRINHGAKFA
ncbi:TFIIB-type zinc ribbon-containing protein [Haladaptatus sp. W1]|uniref:TFIIB-type zinc ribbon-containing protein n=1 Tax=Haladaptatus sp. W1 TaxID=1897478 RepID=UPI0020C82A05|nr:TFIIB-type zinc ribbon-containing protein [Haladaptatus sp. W1]